MALNNKKFDNCNRTNSGEIMAKFKVQVQETNSYYVILEAKSKEDLINNFDNLIFNKDLNKAELFDSDGGILINKDQIQEQKEK